MAAGLALAAFLMTGATASACHKKRCGGHRAVAVATPTCHGGGHHYHAVAQTGGYQASYQSVAPTGYGYAAPTGYGYAAPTGYGYAAPAPMGGRGLFRGMGMGGPIGFGGGYGRGYGGPGMGLGFGGGGYGPGFGGYGPGW
jgi:hypothetical protein